MIRSEKQIHMTPFKKQKLVHSTALLVTLRCSILSSRATRTDLKPNETDTNFLNEEEKMEKFCKNLIKFSLDDRIFNFRTTHLLRNTSINLRTVWQTDKSKNKIPPYQLHRLRQYLKKFKFLYKKYCLTTYPNNLIHLSNRKLNKLAIKILFIL